MCSNGSNVLFFSGRGIMASARQPVIDLHRRPAAALIKAPPPPNAMSSSASLLNPSLRFLLLLLLLRPLPSSALIDPQQNITLILSHLSGYSLFNRLLSSTSVASEINSRFSITVLAPNDSAVSPLLSGFVGGGIPAQQISDTLRYHVLLEYMDIPEMRGRPPGQFVTTLYQTTGRAAGDLGWVSLSVEASGAVGVGLPFREAPPNATILTTLSLFPYNISVLQVDKVLIPPQLATPPALPPINITDVLVQGGKFDTFVAFLQATGVDQIFQDSEEKEGITIFAPADDAFASLSSSSLQKLTAQEKILVMEYHALNAYYALGELKDFKNPVAPTIATSNPYSGGAGQYTVNVTSVGQVCTIYTGVVSAPVMATVMENKPVAIFVIDRVLLPKNIFGSAPSSSSLTPPSPTSGYTGLPASPPDISTAPPEAPPSASPPNAAASPSIVPGPLAPSQRTSSSSFSPLTATPLAASNLLVLVAVLFWLMRRSVL